MLVLAEGRAVEYDHPYSLLLRGSGAFFDLVQQMGSAASAQLLTEARRAFLKTQLAAKGGEASPAAEVSPPLTL